MSNEFNIGVRIESTRNDALVENSEQFAADGNENNSNLPVNDEEVARSQQIAENVKKVLLFGEKVTVGDIEFIHLPGQILKPKEFKAMYEVKSNDLLCGKTPFKELVI